MGGLFRGTLNKEPLVWRDWPICFQLSLCCINEYLPYVPDFYFYDTVHYVSYISELSIIKTRFIKVNNFVHLSFLFLFFYFLKHFEI